MQERYPICKFWQIADFQLFSITVIQLLRGCQRYTEKVGVKNKRF
jgi:hypothetical protein